jgi:glycosyltransferase involved in cell wall biosynthesis
MDVFVVIPAYNESRTIAGVVKDTKEHFDRVIVVDDGSSDDTRKLARKAGARVISHKVNLGVGAATATGVRFALNHGAEIVATIDGDGQHDVNDLVRVVEPVLKDEVDLCIGSRFEIYENAPFLRVIANKLLTLITIFFSSTRITDSQSGMRAFKTDKFRQMNLSMDYYSFCSEMFVEARKLDLRIKEVPIKMIYTEYSQGKGTHIFTPFFIIKDLIFKRLLEG